MAQSLANIVALLRKMFAREELPESLPHERSRLPGPGTLRLLLGPEPLPEDPVPPRDRRPGLLSLILGGEALPEDPVRPRPGPGFFSLVLGREALPEDPPGPPRRRGRWLAWLFSPERVDPS